MVYEVSELLCSFRNSFWSVIDMSKMADKYGMAAEPIKLGDKEYFVLGDNRNESADSRAESVGILHRDEFIGRTRVRIWLLDSFEVIGK